MPDAGPHEWSPRLSLAIYMNAGHTTSGNPRRGWLILEPRTGNHIDFVDEGYAGERSLTRPYPNAVQTGRIDITPAQYREFLRFARDQAKKHKRGDI